MSKYDKEREAMGIKPMASSSTSGKSKYDEERRMMKESASLQSGLSNIQALMEERRIQEMPARTQQQAEQFKSLTGLKTTLPMPSDALAPVAGPPAPTNADLPGRDLPVVGPILRGLDWMEENPYRKKAGEIVQELYTPGAGLGAINTMTQGAESLVAKALPKLGNSLGSKVAKTAATEALVGAPLGAAQYLSSGGTDLTEAAKQGALGAVLGGATGAAAPLLGKAVRGGLDSVKSGVDTVKSGIKAATSGMEQTAAVKGADTMKGNWFTNLFGEQGLGISAFGNTARISKSPLTTADQIVNKSIKQDKEGVKSRMAASIRNTYQNYVDRLSPLKRVSTDAYETAMDATRANNIAQQIVNDKFVTPEGVVVGEGLSNIFKKVARGSDKDFVDYLILRHAKTRMSRGERVYAENLGMTPERIQQKIDDYASRNPGFEEIAKEWDGFNDNVLVNYGVKEDLLSEEAYKALREKNPNYAPMRRQFLQSEKPGRQFLSKSVSSAFSGQKAPIKEVSPTGSVRNIVDPRKTTVESVGAWANAAMRNRVMKNIAQTVSANPEKYKGIIEIVQKPKSGTDLKKILMENGEDDFLEALDEDFKNLFKTTRVDGENIVRAMIKGEPVYMQVHDPELVKTVIGLGPQASNALIDVLTLFSNATKRGATGVLAPVFAVKGATMDLVQSAIQSKNPVQQVTDTVHAIFSSIGDRLNIPGLKNLAEEYRRAGGEFSAALKGDRKLNTNIRNMTRYPLLSRQNLTKTAINTVKAPFKALEAIGDIAENAPRMAAYKGELKRLGGERTPENVRQAMSQAREITTNFSRKGALSRDLEALVPYNNAAVQGTYRVFKGIRERPVQTIAAIGALGVLPKLYEYMQFHDDPDYQNLPARERYRFLIVNKNEDGTFTKIPMEPAYNSVGEVTIEALRKWKDDQPDAFKGAADAIANAWLPPAITGALQGITQDGGLDKSIAGAINATVAAPFVAVTANQSFTGAPIVSRAVSDRSPQYQYDERTSWVAKKLGEYTGMSPMKVDYLMRSYGGDPARLLLPLSSDVGAGNTRNTLLRNFIADPAYSNTLTNDFYSAKEKLTQAYRDNQELGVPLPEWYDDDLRKQLSSTAKGSISKRLSELNAKKKEITANNAILKQQKTEQLRNVQAEINQIYLDINPKLKDKGVPME